MIVTSHAVNRALERFSGLEDLAHGEIVCLLRRIAEQGRDVVDSYVVDQRYVGAEVPGVGLMVVFIKQDRHSTHQVIVSTLTLADAHGAGAARPVEAVA